MCEHCEALRDVFTECAGEKVAEAVMKRVQPRLHAGQLRREPYSLTEVSHAI